MKVPRWPASPHRRSNLRPPSRSGYCSDHSAARTDATAGAAAAAGARSAAVGFGFARGAPVFALPVAAALFIVAAVRVEARPDRC